MSSTDYSETSRAFRPLRSGQYTHTAGIFGSGTGTLSPALSRTAGTGEMNRFSELFRMSGVPLSPEEFRELELFDEFLARHVQPDGDCNVQCMLLWSEWIRVFRSRVSGFPNLVRENEFRSAITGKFGAGIATDGWRGVVYDGVRFVP